MLATIKKPLLFAIFFISVNFLSAQVIDQVSGARAISFGGAYAGVNSDPWTLFSNPAGISGLKTPSAGLFLRNSYLVNELNELAFVGVFPFGETHKVGLGVSSYGFNLYRESLVSLAYAITLYEKFHLGAQINMKQLSLSEYGNAQAFYVNVGGVFAISKEFQVGFSVKNANQARIGTVNPEKIPSFLSAGVSYQPDKNVTIVADVSKQVDFPISFRGGIEYRFVKSFSARVGISSEPTRFASGLSFYWNNLRLDFAGEYHQQLGVTPSLSVNYNFGQNTENEH